MERASCVWCRTFLPSGRAGAGWDSRCRSLSHWSAMMESSMPLPSPSPTPLNQGHDLTAALLGPFCGHIAPPRHHQHLHPHHHPRWVASGTARGLTIVVTQECHQDHRPCRCCHSNTYLLCAVLYVYYEWMGECVCVPKRLMDLWRIAQIFRNSSSQSNCGIIRNLRESWKKDKLKEKYLG